MKIKRIVIDPYDYGSYWEDEINEKLKGSIYLHTIQNANDGKSFIIYAFYPDEIEEKKNNG